MPQLIPFYFINQLSFGDILIMVNRWYLHYFDDSSSLSIYKVMRYLSILTIIRTANQAHTYTVKRAALASPCDFSAKRGDPSLKEPGEWFS